MNSGSWCIVCHQGQLFEIFCRFLQFAVREYFLDVIVDGVYFYTV